MSKRGTSKLGAKGKATLGGLNSASIDQLAIQEESSSLKSVSPLTENSTSRKSLLVSGEAARPPTETQLAQ